MNKFEEISHHTMRSPGDSKKPHGVKFTSEADLEQIFEAANLQYQRGMYGVFDDLEEECRSHLADRGLTWGQEIVERPDLVLSDVRTLVYGSDFEKVEGMTVESTEGLSEADIRTWDISHLLFTLLGLRKELTENTALEEHTDFVYRVFLFALKVEGIKFRSMEQHALVKQRLMDSGREGGRSPGRKERIKDRDDLLRKEAQELLDKGNTHGFVLGRIWAKYYYFQDYPKTRRSYENILRPLKPS